MIAKCPRCGKEKDMAGNPFRPFCGERCKLIDLGNWVSDAYRIPESLASTDEEDADPRGEDSDKS